MAYDYSKLNTATPPKKPVFEPVPEGSYKVLVTSAEEKKTKAGDGLMLAIQAEIAEGPSKGRKLADWIMLEHPKQDVVASGEYKLGMLCLSCGVQAPKGPQSFVSKIGKVQVKIVASRTKPGEFSNEIAEWVPRAAPVAQPAQPAQQPQQVPPVSVGQAAPLHEVDADEPPW